MRVVVNGSFVTNVESPNDADCVLVAGMSYNEQSEAAAALRAGLPFLSLYVVASEDEVNFFTQEFFASDRVRKPKGLVEIMI